MEIGDENTSLLPIKKEPAIEQSSVGEDENKENPKIKLMQDIFHVTKLGFLIPVQTLVEKHGLDILLQYDAEGHSPIHWAALGGHIHIFNFFIQIKAPLDYPAKTSLGSQPIHWASVHGNVQVVQLLIQNGVSIDAVDNKGCSPLIIAAQYGQTMLTAFLIGKGARIDMTDKEGDNSLHWAAFKGHCELTRLLIYSGLNPKVKDNFGQYPIHLGSLSGDLLTVKLLCELDEVEFDVTDHNGNTALKLARGRKYHKLIAYLQNLDDQKKQLFPACNWKTILFGPPGKSKHAFFFSMFMMFCFGYPVYLFRVLPYTLDFQFGHFFFMINSVVMIYCLFKSYTMDPGFLPKNLGDYDKALKQATLFAEWKDGESPLSRLCHTCRLIRPLRSKHCRITNRCVKHFDHYCPYIYNVVGYRNRHYFIVFVAAITTTAFYGAFYSWYVNQYLHTDYFLAFGGMISLLYSMTNLGLAGSMVYSAAANITTNERINGKRYSYLKDGNGNFYNPFNQGPVKNLFEFFHLKAPLVLDSDPSERHGNGLHMV